MNQSLESMAMLFAIAMGDERVRQQVHNSVGKRFDGDFDVLYKSFAEDSYVRRALASAYSRTRAVERSYAASSVDRLASGIPRFQVSVPANFNKWDPRSFTPLVAFLPDGVEDTTLETITAYDAAGNAHELDAQVAPDYPVIVLGLNERTDEAGNLLHRKSLPIAPDAERSSSAQLSTALASTAYVVRMVEVTLFDDNEPWIAGDAEIYLRAKSVASSPTCGVDVEEPNWPLLNNSGDAWSGPKSLGNKTCADVIFYWWEDDGGSFDFTLSYGGISLGTHMDNGDDLIGGVRLGYSSFAGSTMANYRWNDLSQWTD